MKGIVIEKTPVCIYNVEGRFFASIDICTHEEVPLSEGYLHGDIIECDAHGARFDLKTGAVRSAPAVLPLKMFKTKAEDGWVWVDIN